MPALVDTVLVRSWLMDTGCPMNLIDETEAAPFARFIEDCDGVYLATANGLITICRRLELHVDKIEEDVTPLVLANMPNVLSVGRRAVEKGYDFVWRHGEQSYLLHPDDQRRIDLVVRDFCPLPRPCGGRRSAAPAWFEIGNPSGLYTTKTMISSSTPMRMIFALQIKRFTKTVPVSHRGL